MTGGAIPHAADAIRRAFAPALARAPVAAVWLYGSLARGEAKSGSDADLAVLFAAHADADRGRARDDLLRAAHAALGGRRASIVDLDEAPLLLRHRVLRDGVLLADADPRRRTRFAARVLERFAAARAVRLVLDAGTLRRLSRSGAS